VLIGIGIGIGAFLPLSPFCGSSNVTLLLLLSVADGAFLGAPAAVVDIKPV
jgi:hypothetical protein